MFNAHKPAIIRGILQNHSAAVATAQMTPATAKMVRVRKNANDGDQQTAHNTAAIAKQLNKDRNLIFIYPCPNLPQCLRLER